MEQDIATREQLMGEMFGICITEKTIPETLPPGTAVVTEFPCGIKEQQDWGRKYEWILILDPRYIRRNKPRQATEDHTLLLSSPIEFSKQVMYAVSFKNQDVKYHENPEFTSRKNFTMRTFTQDDFPVLRTFKAQKQQFQKGNELMVYLTTKNNLVQIPLYALIDTGCRIGSQLAGQNIISMQWLLKHTDENGNFPDFVVAFEQLPHSERVGWGGAGSGKSYHPYAVILRLTIAGVQVIVPFTGVWWSANNMVIGWNTIQKYSMRSDADKPDHCHFKDPETGKSGWELFRHDSNAAPLSFNKINEDLNTNRPVKLPKDEIEIFPNVIYKVKIPFSSTLGLEDEDMAVIQEQQGLLKQGIRMNVLPMVLTKELLQAHKYIIVEMWNFMKKPRRVKHNEILEAVIINENAGVGPATTIANVVKTGEVVIMKEEEQFSQEQHQKLIDAQKRNQDKRGKERATLKQFKGKEGVSWAQDSGTTGCLIWESKPIIWKGDGIRTPPTLRIDDDMLVRLEYLDESGKTLIKEELHALKPEERGAVLLDQRKTLIGKNIKLKVMFSPKVRPSSGEPWVMKWGSEASPIILEFDEELFYRKQKKALECELGYEQDDVGRTMMQIQLEQVKQWNKNKKLNGHPVNSTLAPVATRGNEKIWKRGPEKVGTLQTPSDPGGPDWSQVTRRVTIMENETKGKTSFAINEDNLNNELQELHKPTPGGPTLLSTYFYYVKRDSERLAIQRNEENPQDQSN